MSFSFKNYLFFSFALEAKVKCVAIVVVSIPHSADLEMNRTSAVMIAVYSIILFEICDQNVCRIILDFVYISAKKQECNWFNKSREMKRVRLVGFILGIFLFSEKSFESKKQFWRKKMCSTYSSLVSFSRKPLAKGLLTIFNWVTCEKKRNELALDSLKVNPILPPMAHKSRRMLSFDRNDAS